MKRTATALLVVFVAGCASAAYHPGPEEVWPLVAKSSVILTGTLEMPVDRIRACLASNCHAYVDVTVTTGQVLKGHAPPHLAVRWFTELRHHAPEPERVISFNGRQALIFLHEVQDPAVKGFYFAGDTPRALSDAGDAHVQEVRREVAAQQEILLRFAEDFPPAKEPLLGKVRGLMDAATRKATQADAFRRLEELGTEGVPAIIIAMDDRRDLADAAISLRNLHGGWEGVRHYGPQKVVDAMDAILNQITGEYFGDIQNGGTEAERNAVVERWRIYLYHWKKRVPPPAP